VPASRRAADFYAKARLVPDNRIVSLNVPGGEEIPFDKYEQDVVPPIRDFLRKNGLQSKIKCLVTFFGVPLRISGHSTTAAEQQEIADLHLDLRNIEAKVGPVVAAVEA